MVTRLNSQNQTTAIMSLLFYTFHTKRGKNLIFINPESDYGNSLRKWKKEVGDKFGNIEKWTHVEFENVSKIIESISPDVVIVGGGDGSVNSIGNVLMSLKSKRPLFGIVPLGYGNAVAYNLGINTVKDAMDVILTQTKSKKIDLIKTDIPRHKYVFFNISLGFDAQIVHYHQETKPIRMFSYILSTIRSLFSFRLWTLHIVLDKSTKIKSKSAALVVTNGKYIGLKYQVNPNSSIDNGFLDCVIFPSRRSYLKNLQWSGYNHPLFSNDGNVFLQAKILEVWKTKFMQIDGDPVVYHKRVVIRNVDKAIECLCA